MITSFDLTKLKFLLKDFYNLTRIRITVFNEDFVELVSYPEHIAPFCRVIRTDPEGSGRCKRCDEAACRQAAGRHSPYTYRCHAGLTESITPLYLGNIIIGYLFFGHVFAYPSHEQGWEEIGKRCRDYHVDKERLKEACFSMPVRQEDYIMSAAHILQAVASFLCLERIAYLRRQELPVQIDKYLQEHFTEDIDAVSVAEHFGIGKTQLYEIVKRNYNMGVAAFVRKLRIEKARALLEDAELPVAEIASQCGFRDYNYFITVFRREVGIPPKTYQKRAGAAE